MLRELNERNNGGITVSLFWEDSAKSYPQLPEFQVRVLDADGTEKFVFSIDNFTDAREAYFHPFAVANRYLKSGKFSSLVS